MFRKDRSITIKLSAMIVAMLSFFLFPASSFSGGNVDKFTGAAITSIPIGVAPGRAGIQPNLSLNYNSQSGNGWLGVGWSLGMGSIQRATKHGVDYTAKDFVANGAELVPISVDASGNGEYRAKIESQFTKYVYNTSSGWIATTSVGTKYYYGQTTSTRQDNSSGVFSWCLDRVEDTNGNYMTVSYTKDNGAIYLDRIDYTGNTHGIGPKNYVKFYLDDTRIDKPALFSTNSKVVIAKRLKTIEVRSTIQGLVRTYSFDYLNSQLTNQSLLNNVKQFGNNVNINTSNGTISSGSSLPINTYTATYYPELSGFAPPTIWGTGFFPGDKLLGDFNGDGKTDVIQFASNGNAYVWLSNGSGFDGPTLWGTGFFPGDILLGDFDGDGKTDVIQFDSSGNAYVWLSNRPGINNGPTLWGTGHQPSDKLGDFDGDGKTDVIQFYQDVAYVWLSNGAGFYGNRFDGSTVWGTGFTPSDQLGDFLGNGKTDVIQFYQGVAYVWLSNGAGFYGNRLDGSTVWGTGFSPGDKLGNFNGDGKTGVIHFDEASQYSYVWLSNGSGFEPPTIWGTGHLPSDQLGDFLGNGKTDVIQFYQGVAYVWLSNGAGFEPSTPWSIGGHTSSDQLGDFNGDGKTDIIQFDSSGNAIVWPSKKSPTNLLNTISINNSTTTFYYTPSTSYYNTKLPFVVQTVSATQINNGFGNFITTNYFYEGGYYDASDRAFRGFNNVSEHMLVDGGPNSGVITRTNYYQDKFRAGLESKVETFLYNNNTPMMDYYGGIIQKVNDWEYEPWPSNQDRVFLKLVSTSTTQYDNGSTVNTGVSYTYDESWQHGSVLTTTTSGPGADPVLTTKYYTNFGTDVAQVWRITEETVQPVGKNILRKVDYNYFPTTGNLMWQKAWLNGTLDIAQPLTSYTYDTYGNLHTVTDPMVNTTTTDYDTTTYTFPVKVTAPDARPGPSNARVQHVVQYLNYDYGFGKPTTFIDENNNTTQSYFDEFGRTIRVDAPDGGQTVTIYNDNIFPREVITMVNESDSGSNKWVEGFLGQTGYLGCEGRGLETHTFYDGLGREIEKITIGDPDPKSPLTSRTIITDYTYNQAGQLGMVMGPFFGTSTAFAHNNGWYGTGQYKYKGSVKFYYYDNLLRIINVKDITNVDYYGSVAYSTTAISYCGTKTTTTDPDGNIKSEIRDYLGHVVEVDENNGGNVYKTKYQYNIVGDLLTVTDQLGNVTTINYDTLGRKTDMTDSDMGHWQYPQYDNNGNLLTQIDNNSITTSFNYDNLNRLTHKTISPLKSIDYTYDTATNGIGKPGSINQDDGPKITFDSYDQVGRLKSQTKTIDNSSYNTQYTFDFSGKMKSVQYPDGYTVSYDYYNQCGLIKRVYGPTSDGKNTINYGTFNNYDSTGKIGNLYFANNIYSEYTYDPYSKRLMNYGTETTDNKTTFIYSSYIYSNSGDIRQVYGVKNNTAFNYGYSYDDLHRLKQETNNFTGDYASYVYDPIGRIQTKTVKTGASISALTYTPATADTSDSSHINNHAHAIGSVTNGSSTYNMVYDRNGNMTNGYDFADPTNVVPRSISYNADNMPDTITRNGAVTSIVYDGTENRAKKTVNGKTTIYASDNYEIRNGVATRYIFGGNLRIASVTNGSVTFFHKDHLGSTVMMTDMNGQLVPGSDTNYTPYGLDRTSNTSNTKNYYKFTDQESDAEAGLYNYGARMYDPSLGIFVMADTMVARPRDPQSLNRYSYCRNNPLVYIDPSGHDLTPADMTFNLSDVMFDQMQQMQASPQSPIGITINAYSFSVTTTGTDGTPYTLSISNNISSEGVLVAGYNKTTNDNIRDDRIKQLFGPNSYVSQALNSADYGNAARSYTNEGVDNPNPLLDPVNYIGIGYGALNVTITVTKTLISTGDIAVYSALDASGNTIYVGITNNLERRFGEHLAQKGIQIDGIPGLGNLSKFDAKAVEQVLIETFGLQKNGGTLINIINSISPKNPIYQQSIERGLEILKSIGINIVRP